MAIKRKISKADFEALTDDKKEFYIENVARKGEYVLDLGDDADNPLKAANDRLKADKEALEASIETLNADLTTAKATKQPANGSVSKEDHEAFKKSAEDKLKAETTKLTQAIDKKDGFIRKSLIKDRALTIASTISKVPKLLARSIEDRLSVDFDGDEPKLVVLDVDGKPSAFTPDDLQQEFVANKDYADIIIGSKGGGGSAHQPAPFGGSALNSEKPVNLTALEGKDLVAHMRSVDKTLL